MGISAIRPQSGTPGFETPGLREHALGTGPGFQGLAQQGGAQGLSAEHHHHHGVCDDGADGSDPMQDPSIQQLLQQILQALQQLLASSEDSDADDGDDGSVGSLRPQSVGSQPGSRGSGGAPAIGGAPASAGTAPAAGPAPAAGTPGPASTAAPAAGDGTPEDNVKAWVDQAAGELAKQGITMTDRDKANMATVAMHESSGNPTAVNNWDYNAQAGTPSKGLVQTIQSTFDANSSAGHTDIMNPVDDIMAGFKYAEGKYGSTDNIPGIKSLDAGGSYVGY
ncbi:MAG: transglycosylase SLT domain-containing protein [Burkholderiaceae bacterium]